MDLTEENCHVMVGKLRRVNWTRLDPWLIVARLPGSLAILARHSGVSAGQLYNRRAVLKCHHDVPNRPQPTNKLTAWQQLIFLKWQGGMSVEMIAKSIDMRVVHVNKEIERCLHREKLRGPCTACAGFGFVECYSCYLTHTELHFHICLTCGADYERPYDYKKSPAKCVLPPRGGIDSPAARD